MNMPRLSKLPKTWIIDLDGTIFRHNAYLESSKREVPLPGVKDFFSKIPPEDFIIIVTSRDSIYKESTEKSLTENGLRYNILLMGLPVGERILINDKKESGMKTAYAINIKRNVGLGEVLERRLKLNEPHPDF